MYGPTFNFFDWLKANWCSKEFSFVYKKVDIYFHISQVQIIISKKLNKDVVFLDLAKVV